MFAGCLPSSSLPVAPQKVAVHWVNSDEALELIPKPNKRHGDYRMKPVIPAACNASNIEYWARMGTAMVHMLRTMWMQLRDRGRALLLCCAGHLRLSR
jgi:hypothetical protein